MALNKVELCGINTGTLPVLKNDQMRAMLEKIKRGDEQARQDFIGGNLRLVLSVIQRFQGRGDDLEDLFQIGCIGLIKSIDNFDLSQNVRFSTYAVPMTVACRKARGESRAGKRGGEEGRFPPASGRQRAVEKNLRKFEKNLLTNRKGSAIIVNVVSGTAATKS